MLKIKDNVDLKELVVKLEYLSNKYGYEFRDGGAFALITFFEDKWYEKGADGKKILIQSYKEYQIWKDNGLNYDRQIRLLGLDKCKKEEFIPNWTSWSMTELDLLYDLIKDDLVEKVE